MNNQQTKQNSIGPTTLVIFGATGDLSKSKLFPALVELFEAGNLPDQFYVVGVSRQSFTDAEFRTHIKEEVTAVRKLSDKDRSKFLSIMHFVSGDVTKSQTYETIHHRLNKIDERVGVCMNKLFYLALPPRFYTEVGSQFGDSKLMKLCQKPDSWLRVLVEKPYGTDLQTAESIDDVLCDTFSSDQLFRIDHYLAKQSLQNVITLRFRNQIFSGGWNRDYIDNIHVKMFEEGTVANRGSFYDQIGAFRDVGQNHVLQLLAAATMEPPADETAETIRESRADLLEDLHLPDTSETTLVRGQYEGFKDNQEVADQSSTETYFRVQAEIANQRWRGVPVILESGKGLKENRVEVEISYREPSSRVNSVEPVTGNTMILQFKPNRGVVFDIWTESADLDAGINHRTVNFSYSPNQREPTAYTALLNQAMRGEQAMFANNREVRASWQFTESVVKKLSNQTMQKYPVGSTGP